MKCKNYYINCKCCGKRIYEINPLVIVDKKLFCSDDCAFMFFTGKKLKRTVFIPDAVSKKNKKKIRVHEYDCSFDWLEEDLDD